VRVEELQAALQRSTRLADDEKLEAGSEEQEVIERAALELLRSAQQQGEADIVAVELEKYLQTVPGHLSQLRLAVELQDAELMVEIAQALKKSSVQIGTKRIIGLCAEMERKAKTGDLSEAGKVVKELEAAFHRAEQLLKQEV
jgi:HPt (histidine-containing phosphotransfer) domain-containing protein